MTDDHQEPLSGDDPESNPLELFQKASEAVEAEEYEQALEYARQALEDELTGEELANQLKALMGYCHFKAYRFEEALKWYREAGDEVEMTDDEYYAYAYTLYHEQEYHEAYETLDRISEEFQDDPAVLTLRGVVAHNFDDPDWETVLDLLLRAAEKEPEESENFIIAECLRMLERYEESYPYYRKAIEAQPDNARRYYSYGLAKFLGEEPEEAIAALQESLAYDDQQGEVHLNLARMLIANDRKEEALGHVEKAIELGEPEARELLGMMASSLEDTGEEEEEYEWEEEDPAKRIHPLAQYTLYSIRHRFPMKLFVMLGGVALVAVVAIGAVISKYEQVPGPPPVVDETLRAHEATSFISMCQFTEGDRVIETSVPRGAELKPVARYRRHILVELADGQRGLLPYSAIDRYYHVTLPPGTRLYREPQGTADMGEVGENGARAINLSNISDFSTQRQRVRLTDGGNVAYVQNRVMRRDLTAISLPTVNASNQRLYKRERLEQLLQGADINQVTRRLGVPLGRLDDRETGQTVYLFPRVMVVEQGQRWNRTAVIMENDQVTRIVGQGETETRPIDQMTAINHVQKAGLPNLFLQSPPWFTPVGTDWITGRLDQLKDWSRGVGWIVHIIVILIFIGLALVVLYSIFGLPLLLTWPLIYLLGKTTRLPNAFLKLVMWLLLAAGFTAFFFTSMAVLDISYSNFVITLYGIFLFFFFLRMGQQGSEYLHASRCTDCRIWKSANILGSLYLGYDRSVSYDRVYTGKSTSMFSDTVTYHYEDRPRYSYTYYYQDFFNCMLCGKTWDTNETERRQRADMDHGRVPA
ncbi:tetratricopeptide repeat protein [Balneolales bacterium ANBcel1]|nr:tetratricopeptide repeat protein [Balneolales bacterium ANBcel1]